MLSAAIRRRAVTTVEPTDACKRTHVRHTFNATTGSPNYCRNLCRVNGNVAIPPRTSSKRVEGSGTAAALPTTPASGANAAITPPEPDSNVLLSTVSRPEPMSPNGEESLDGRIDDEGNAAKTRLSNRLTSTPGSVAAKRSMAAIRFSNRWPETLLIEPDAIAA